jgi:endonuclease III
MQIMRQAHDHARSMIMDIPGNYSKTPGVSVTMGFGVPVMAMDIHYRGCMS